MSGERAIAGESAERCHRGIWLGRPAERGRPVSGLLPRAQRPRRAAAPDQLAVRVTLLVVAVAVLVAVIASVVGVLVVRRTLIDVTTQALSDRADVIAAQVAGRPRRRPTRAGRGRRRAGRAGHHVVDHRQRRRVHRPSRAVRSGAAQAGAHQAVDGRSVSGSAFVGGGLQLVEARSTANGGFALVAPADVAAATRQALERRLLWAILGGLVAAVLVGLLVARVVSAPLRRTAGLARAMGRARATCGPRLPARARWPSSPWRSTNSPMRCSTANPDNASS